MYAVLAAPLRAIAARRPSSLDVLDVSGSPFMLAMLGERMRLNVTCVTTCRRCRPRGLSLIHI